MQDLTQPSWQVKYSDYGGLKEYTDIKNMYWGIASYYMKECRCGFNNCRHSVTGFSLMGYEKCITDKLEQFRRDLKKEHTNKRAVSI